MYRNSPGSLCYHELTLIHVSKRPPPPPPHPWNMIWSAVVYKLQFLGQLHHYFLFGFVDALCVLDNSSYVASGGHYGFIYAIYKITEMSHCFPPD